jgi:hypothetical protein
MSRHDDRLKRKELVLQTKSAKCELAEISVASKEKTTQYELQDVFHTSRAIISCSRQTGLPT